MEVKAIVISVLTLIANLGAKGIAVATGGTLSLWGRDKKPTWTRLAKNANPGIRIVQLILVTI